MKQFGWVLVVAAGLGVLLAGMPLPATAQICPSSDPSCVTTSDLSDDAVTEAKLSQAVRDLLATATAVQARLTAMQTSLNTLRTNLAGNTARPTCIKVAPVSGRIDDVVFRGCNVHVQNGHASASTATTNGAGNLIIGYNKDYLTCSTNTPGCTPSVSRVRTGSHNLVVGDEHSYSSYGGLVAGFRSTISGAWASVSGGGNTASGLTASVSGGLGNTASGQDSTAMQTTIANLRTSITTNTNRIATLRTDIAAAPVLPNCMSTATVSGRTTKDIIFSGCNVHVRNGHSSAATATTNGAGNLIIGYNEDYTVNGTARARGGSHNLVVGAEHSYSSHGGLVAGKRNTISGAFSSVIGGGGNTASGANASVRGGRDNTASGQDSTAVQATIAAVQATIAAMRTSLTGNTDQMATLRTNLEGNTARPTCIQTAAVSGRIDDVVFRGCNVHVQNGHTSASTATKNGDGNLIIGYNEDWADPNDNNRTRIRTGSHNLVVGSQHSYSAAGGLVAGFRNTISLSGSYNVLDPHSSVVNTVSGIVSGGSNNTAGSKNAGWDGGYGHSVSGGSNNTAHIPQGDGGSGGRNNTVIAGSISGGRNNRGNVSGGRNNTASGGYNNTASGLYASANGGWSNTASGNYASISGGKGNTASGLYTSVSGGDSNTAIGNYSSVSGGRSKTTSSQYSTAMQATITGMQTSITGLQTSTTDMHASIATHTDQITNLRPKVAALNCIQTATVSGRTIKDVIFRGCNVHVQNGHASAATATTNGAGNLIIGYNEDYTVGGARARGGSHNLVVGAEHAYSSHGGLVAGKRNTISGAYASVSGGSSNTASGANSSVNGGASNTASGQDSTSPVLQTTLTDVDANTSQITRLRSDLDKKRALPACMTTASVTGRTIDDIVFSGCNVHVRNGHTSAATATTNGAGNLIIGYNEDYTVGGNARVRTGSHNLVVGPQHSYSSYGGLLAGGRNTVSGQYSTVSGGWVNEASGDYASVSGGGGATASSGNTASGDYATVSGGRSNTASGQYSTVSGGSSKTASAQDSHLP